MFAREFVHDIGPEFFEEIRCHVRADQQAEFRRSISEVSIVGTVSHRDSDGAGISSDFRIVELRLAGVAVRQEGLACRIYQS